MPEERRGQIALGRQAYVVLPQIDDALKAIENDVGFDDEGALLEVLTQRKIAGAGVDVFSEEPLPVDHPFRKLDNMVLTPHLGYVTEDSFRNHYRQMVEGIDAWFKGEPKLRLA